jgi:hypothetical protein
MNGWIGGLGMMDMTCHWCLWLFEWVRWGGGGGLTSEMEMDGFKLFAAAT